jgi:hypothetical protein
VPEVGGPLEAAGPGAEARRATASSDRRTDVVGMFRADAGAAARRRALRGASTGTAWRRTAAAGRGRIAAAAPRQTVGWRAREPRVLSGSGVCGRRD